MALRIALLGAGRIGQVHAKAIAGERDATLVAVADAVPAAAEALVAQYGGDVRSIETIAAADDVDAVLICTPTDMHADLIELFARAGKAIFCEKPVDQSIDRVRACLKVVEQTGTLFMVGFNRRFDPHFRALKHTIDSGQIGAVEQLIITSRDPGLPPHDYIKRSGGLFRDMMIHDFDMARYLLDAPIVSVYATAAALVDPTITELGDVDTATAVLRCANGAQVAITNSRRATYGYDQRIEAHGSAGMVQAENQRAADIVVANAGGFTKPVLLDFFMTRYLEAYAAEIASFVAAAAGTGPLEASGADGVASLVLADAATLSAQTGQVVML